MKIHLFTVYTVHVINLGPTRPGKRAQNRDRWRHDMELQRSAVGIAIDDDSN